MKKELLLIAIALSFFAPPAKAGPFDDIVFITNMQLNGDATDAYNYYLIPPASGIGIIVTDPSLSNTGNGQGTMVFANQGTHILWDSITQTFDAGNFAASDISGLGTAATASASSFATSAQGTLADSALQSASIGSTVQAYSGNLDAFAINGSSFYVPATRQVNGHALSADVTITKSDISLGSVENTALSTWAGSGSITTLGTISSGTVPVARVSGLATVATSGAYADLSGRPTNLSSFTNGPGYITGITSGNVTTALGFTPYNATNPSGYVDTAGARSAISLTTVGTGGAATYVSGVLNVPNYAPASRSFTNNASKTIVTSATGQGGVVLDASRDVLVNYWVDSSITTNIGGTSSATAFLEIASTNSATGSDWTTLSKASNANTITLAIALQSVQPQTLNLSAVIPAGQYVRIRDALAGTASMTYGGGQEVKL